MQSFKQLTPVWSGSTVSPFNFHQLGPNPSRPEASGPERHFTAFPCNNLHFLGPNVLGENFLLLPSPSFPGLHILSVELQNLLDSGGDSPYKQVQDNSELSVLTDPQQLTSATATSLSRTSKLCSYSPASQTSRRFCRHFSTTRILV
jgi:hypothetical protein